MSSVMDVCPLSVIHSCLSRTSYSVSRGKQSCQPSDLPFASWSPLFAGFASKVRASAIVL